MYQLPPWAMVISRFFEISRISAIDAKVEGVQPKNLNDRHYAQVRNA
jgi:hypothetical protein